MSEKKASAVAIPWKADVESKDYEAAYNYLSIRLDPERARKAVEALKNAPVQVRRANDILRATDRLPLGLEDPGVRKNFDKFFAGEKLSPVLVVSFDNGGDIADGYHRVSFSYLVSPYTEVPLKIAVVPGL